jgi:hypothetical protein
MPGKHVIRRTVTQAQHALVHDVKLEFKSSMRDGSRIGPSWRDVAGRYWYESDGDEGVDCEVIDPTGRIRVTVGLDSSKGIRKSKLRNLADNGGQQGFIGSGAGELDSPQMPGRILFLSHFRNHSAQIRQSFSFEGWEVIDGHNCLRMSYEIIHGLPADRCVRQRFWIDLERGAHPLRMELSRGGKVQSRLAEIELARFSMGQSAFVWLPIRGVQTHHVVLDSKPLPNQPRSLKLIPEPASVEETSFESVAVNGGLSDEQKSVLFERGTHVRDEFLRVTYSYGQPADSAWKMVNLTPDEAELVIDSGIEEAEEQVQRTGTGRQTRKAWAATPQALAIVLGGLSLLVLMLAFWMRINRRLV